MATFSRGPSRSLQSHRKCYVYWRCRQTRSVSSTASLLSGHNRWSTIKHDKAKSDTAKHKQRSVFAQEIATVSRLYGGDVRDNPRLATIVATAKKAGFPKTSIEASIARGQGLSATGAKLDSLLVEAILPPSVATIIDCQTENKARTLSDVRLKIKNSDGRPTPTSHLFEKRGRIVFGGKEGVGMDEFEEAVLEMETEAIPLDYWEEDGKVVVETRAELVSATADALGQSLGLEVMSSEIIWDPVDHTRVAVDEGTSEALAKFFRDMLEIPGVQNVYMNAVAQTPANDL